VSAVSLRYGNVYGPRQDPLGEAGVIAIFCGKLLDGGAATIFGDGEQTRDMIPVGAVTAVLTDAVLRRVSHPTPVNLASGSRRSLLDIMGQLEEILGTDIARDHQPPRAGDVRHSQADTSALHRLFPALDTPDFTDELRATVAWFRERGS
jgi:UDP-glucose 4-epimerase